MTTRHALVDVGSNTIRMNIYDIDNEKGEFSLLFSEKETLGILNFIENRTLTKTGMDKLLFTLSTFKNCAQSVKCGYFTCFATASLRGILNKKEVLNKINARLGITVDLISGSDEALYDFYSIKKYFSPNSRKGLMIDVGGGSTEFLSFENDRVLESASENIASLLLHKKFVSKILPQKDEIAEIIKYTDRKLKKILWLCGNFDEVFFIGGTARAIAKIHRAYFKNSTFSPLNGYKIKRSDIFKILDCYCENRKELTESIIKEIPDRIHTFIPGLVLYTRVMNKVQCEYITISSFGVREGYLVKNILNRE